MEDNFLGTKETCFPEISDLTINLGYASFEPLLRCQNFEIMKKKNAITQDPWTKMVSDSQSLNKGYAMVEYMPHINGRRVK